MTSQDPKGYYAALGIAPSASDEDIKAAYRRKALELHPDRNKADDATQRFQFLSEAYTVLRDPVARAAYDTSGISGAESKERHRNAPPEPIVCSSCQQVSAQPRYVIFYEVKSFVVFTRRTTIQGIFCSRCAERKALIASTITWIIGWWGFPWGPLYSIHALIVNLAGGTRPPDTNAKIATYQAWYFAAIGRPEIAAATAHDALDLARRIKVDKTEKRRREKLGHTYEDEGKKLRESVEDLLSNIGASNQAIRLKNSWALLQRPFFVQAAPLVLAIFGMVQLANEPAQAPVPGPNPYVTSQPATPPHGYEREEHAPNGARWPKTAAYIGGYPKENMHGRSRLTIDNSENEADVFAKLVSLDGPEVHPVRTFFISGRSKFTLTTITAGQYDLRYRDLNSGRLVRSDKFTLEETEEDGGIRYSDATFTLYRVRDGNMETHALGEDEF